MHKQFKYKCIFLKVMSVASALVLCCILLFSCVFSTNAFYQEYLIMLEPTSSGLYSVDALNGIFIDIGSQYGFSRFGTYNNFSTDYNQSLNLYRYRTSSLYPINNSARIDYASIFDLSRGVFFQAGYTYRFRFYVEAGTEASKYFWWENKTPEEIQTYKDAYLYKGEYSKFYLSYIQLGSERIALVPANVSTRTIGDSNLRYICFYDFTITFPAGVSNPQLVINCSFNFRDDFVGSTQFTCGVSQCSVYQVFDSIADAPVFPTPDDSVTNDYSDLESSLHDFSSNSGADGFLDSSNLETSLGTGAISAMRGVSNILQYAYDKWPWLQTLVYFSVALGIIGLLFNFGSALLGRRKGG